MGINVDEAIEYKSLKGFNYEYPIVSAAVVYSNVAMVQLFVSHGARITFTSQPSLIYLMIETLKNEDSCWMSPIDYLNVLYYLLKVSNFDKYKDKDSVKCSCSWQKILDNPVSDEMNFGKESLGIIAKISNEFFSTS